MTEFIHNKNALYGNGVIAARPANDPLTGLLMVR